MQQMRAERGGEVGLAGSRRPDPEHQRMRAHEIEIGGLRRRTGIGHTPRRGADRRRSEGGADRSCGLLARKPNLRIDLWQIASFPALEPRIERAQYRRGALAAVGASLDSNEIAAHGDANIEFLFEPDKVPLM